MQGDFEAATLHIIATCAVASTSRSARIECKVYGCRLLIELIVSNPIKLDKVATLASDGRGGVTPVTSTFKVPTLVVTIKT